MKKIQNFINKIRNIGVNDKLSNADAKKIRLMNGIVLFTIIALIVGIFIDISSLYPFNLSDTFSFFDLFFASPEIKKAHTDKWILLIPATEIFFLMIILLILFLNYLKKHKLSVLIFCFASPVFTGGLYITQGTMAFSYVMLSYFAPLLFYSKKSSYIAFLLFYTLFALAIAVYINNYSTLIILPIDYAQETKYFNIIISIALISLVIDYFQTESTNFENQLREQNAILLSQSEEISTQREELQTTLEEIQNKKDIIDSEKNKLNNILEMLPNAALIIDKHGVISFWNKALENMTGCTATQMIGKGDKEYAKPFYGKARPILIDLTNVDDEFLKENYKGVRKKNNVLRAETYVPSLKGEERYLIGYASSIYAKNGEYQGAVEVIEDYTERQKQKEKIEDAHKHITDSINYAKRIQQAVFPQIEFLNENFSDNFILFRPRDVVSGDFYWMNKIGDRIIIAAADCTGHGVPGAFMSLLGISFLNEIIANKNVNTAGEILNYMREKIKITLRQSGKINEQKDGMDMALCIIDKNSQCLQYAGAYNPLYLVQKQDKLTKNLDTYRLVKQDDTVLIEIKANKQPLGIHAKEKPFVTHRINIQKGDKLYLFSDGFSDQFSGKDGRKFMSKNFKKTLIDIHDNSMKEQFDILNKTLDDWQDGTVQIDDILVVGIQI